MGIHVWRYGTKALQTKARHVVKETVDLMILQKVRI